MQVTARRNASLPPSPSKNNAEEVLRRGAIETSRPAARPASNALINFAAMACSLCRCPAGKQCPDQLRGHGLFALRTLIPLQAVSERVCVG